MPGKRQHQLIFDSILLGVVGALAAQVFMLLLHWAQAIFLGFAQYQPPGLPEEGGMLREVVGPHGLWLIPVVTTIGGLISGLLVYTFAPEAEGHGTDTAVKAYHFAEGFIRGRVSPLKAVASAITIGSGGAAGREGPTALISAGIGSIYATLFHRPAEERRLLVLMGMAAGLAAIFRSPVGTAFFAIEVLYSDMEFEAFALLYVMLASIVAYTINGLFVGFDPLFTVPTMAMPAFGDYFWYILLGLVAGVVAAMLPSIFYYTRDAFHAIPIPPHIKPAIGGLLLGLMAVWLPQVLGGGYGWIQLAIDGKLMLGTMAILVLAKMIAMALTVSSGGSGGVFAPGLYVGAMLGGSLAAIFHLPAAAFVVVGMAAVFGGAARVPIATLLMVTEMTGGYHLLVAAALAVSISYIVEVLLTAKLKYNSLYEAQVEGREDSPAHHGDYLKAALHILRNHNISLSGEGEWVNLDRLLATGIPIDLEDDKQLRLGRLAEKSPLVNQRVRDLLDLLPQDLKDEVRVSAIFRERHTLIPYGDLAFKPGDRVLFIATPRAWKALEEHFQFDYRPI
ncbi:MAG: chloride channel protein [Chloroflexi bacterium]|nr:chloride channel protein [Chloroflexota bacterium]